MASAAKNFTIQINSSQCDKLSGEHYRMRLTPPIEVPYLAEPRVMLEQLAFTNAFVNVDSSRLQNNVLRLKWRSYKVGDTSPAWYTEELHLDDGFYGLDGLEYAIAKLIRQSSASAPSYVFDKDTQTLGTNLWDTMDTMVQANAFYSQDDPTLAATNAGSNHFDLQSKGTIKTPDPNFTAVPAGKLLIPVMDDTLMLWRRKAGAEYKLTQPPEWLIGSKLLGIPSGNSMEPYVGATIVAVHKLDGAAGAGGSLVDANGVAVSLGASYGIELSTVGTRGTALFTGNDAKTLTFQPAGNIDPNFRGYSLAGLAQPSTAASSAWVSSVTADEMQLVASTPSAQANYTIVGDTASTLGLEQWQRYAHPFTFGQDAATGKLMSFAAYGGVYVAKGSTLFTGLLGYSDDQLCNWDTDPTAAQMRAQNPFAGAAMTPFVAAVKNRNMFLSTEEIKVLRTRSLEFHCPTLVPPSYGPDGKQSGAQVASVPVTAPQNSMQTWQATWDSSVPTDLHGATIDSIEFYLTDQNSVVQDLQKTSFQATLRLFYADPLHAKIGEAGAEQDPTVGLRDVTFRY